MSFSFHVSGHAGSGMDAGSQEEIDGVHAICAAALDAAKTHNLNLTLYGFSPQDWAPEVSTTETGQAAGESEADESEADESEAEGAATES